jgi:N-acetylglucosaminyldiphosphoundecaprenol N-acetyl-beta-D-mannosaminyltransferase
MNMLANPVRTAPASVDPAVVPHVEFLGLPFCLLSQSEVVRLLLTHCGAPFRYVITPNAFHFAAVDAAPQKLLPLYRDAWLSVCDSRIVRALARFDGRDLPLVTGSDLVAALLETLNRHDFPRSSDPILVVGPSRGIETALRAAYPNVTFDVLPAPEGLAQSAELRLGVARACLDRQWVIALLCVGYPVQEMIARQIAELGCPSGVALCVGASIDFLTGKRTRAPLWVRQLSLEWAYRLLQEPRRLWRRYLVESPKILRIFLKARLLGGPSRNGVTGPAQPPRRDV